MKTTYTSILIVWAILLTACGYLEKKEVKATSEETKTKTVEPSKQKGINLKQTGDYTQLYTESEDCKLTASQMAEALRYDKSSVKQDIFNNSCRYIVNHPSGFTAFYYIRNEKWPKNIVEDQIKSGLKNDLIDVQVSESGDTYITRHPAQGFLLLLNTNYENPIKISYSYLNPNGPKLTNAQKEERKQNTYKIANYLINHYKK